MKNLGLRVRLLLFFIGISCIVWLVSGAVSLRESREKVDGFLISIKCCWHGSLLRRIGQKRCRAPKKHQPYY